ncbi:hypothetical protein [Streptomyces sp. PU_AKi4]|uniref:hypothetical protein n=1 Tax=Streptomyces sp. PU_AKi4 TaxID=2800809 RepID=UPI003526B053
MSQGLVDGRFRIGQVIGRGNMGEARRAEDLHAPEGSPERTAAVKTIPRSRTGARIDTGGDAKAVQRFSREVRITRRLHHPHPTRLVAGGIDERAEGPPFLAMEFLDGETLRDLVEEESRNRSRAETAHSRPLRREPIQHTDGVRAKGVVRHHRPHEEQQ